MAVPSQELVPLAQTRVGSLEGADPENRPGLGATTVTTAVRDEFEAGVKRGVPLASISGWLENRAAFVLLAEKVAAGEISVNSLVLLTSAL